MNDQERIRWNWSEFWSNLATNVDDQGLAPDGTVALYETLSELEPDKALDAVEAEVLTLSNDGLAWARGGLTSAYAVFAALDAPAPLLEDVSALVERIEDEATSRGLER